MMQPTTQSGIFGDLQSLGFKTPRYGTVQKADLATFYETMKADREGLDYDVDGVVMSVESLALIEDLGLIDRKCPRGQIAIKYPPMTGQVLIKEIFWSTDGAAHLSPVAIFDPVDMMGAEIRRSHFKSYRWMTSRAERVKYFRGKLKDEGVPADQIPALAEDYAGTGETVGVGSVVEIARSGDVIPTIKRVITNTLGTVEKVTTCPCCAAAVVENGAFLDCTNDECDAKEAARMRRFLVALRVKGLGQDTLILYSEAGVKVRDFFQEDGFAGLEAKIAKHPDISMTVWQKIKTQLEAE